MTVRAECRTTSGERVALITPVSADFYEDVPMFTAYALHVLAATAKGAGEDILPDTLTHYVLTTVHPFYDPKETA